MTRPRESANLSQLVNHYLNVYAAAASAAGVGLLALTQPAEGEVIYTPAHVQLMNQGQVFLDLNHDGKNDFSFYGMSISRRSISTFYFRLTASPAETGNAIWGVESHEHTSCAARVAAGEEIGPLRPFHADRAVLLDWSGNPNGGTAFCPWLGTGSGGTGYLGLKFVIKDQVHFGWARLKVGLFNGQGTFLTGYAYETIPDKGIIAGQTKGRDVNTVQPDSGQGALGGLALGRR